MYSIYIYKCVYIYIYLFRLFETIPYLKCPGLIGPQVNLFLASEQHPEGKVSEMCTPGPLAERALIYPDLESSSFAHVFFFP